MHISVLIDAHLQVIYVHLQLIDAHLRLPHTGVDPKSVVCEFFRHGQCTKGFKCKYSHDLAVERKGPKIDLFTDQRDTGAGEDEVNMMNPLMH